MDDGDYTYEDFLDDLDAEEREDDDDELNEFGCLFPSECVMQGYHMKSECHTAEMLEAQHNYAGQPLEQFMDYLTHDIEDWADECRGGVIRTPDGDVSLLVAVMDRCLENPQLSKWRNAFVWHLCEKYGDNARVLLREEVER